MRIALAQIASRSGELAWNIGHHLEAVRQLQKGEADLVIFPELSLTNYDPELAESVAMEPGDARLEPFQHLADRTGTIIGIGLPARGAGKPTISLLLFTPRRPRLLLGKMYLHEDEKAYFAAAPGPLSMLELSTRVAIAICHEINVDAHIQAAAALGMDLYLASVAKTAQGVAEAGQRLARLASERRIPMLLVNCVGSCEGKNAGGGSMVVGADGRVIARLDSSTEQFLLFDTKTGNTRTIPIPSTQEPYGQPTDAGGPS